MAGGHLVHLFQRSDTDAKRVYAGDTIKPRSPFSRTKGELVDVDGTGGAVTKRQHLKTWE